MTIKPKGLGRGSRVGIICLSNGINMLPESTVTRGLQRLRDIYEWTLVLAENVRKEDEAGLSAGTVSERVESLHSFFKDESIDGIIAFWGGFVGHQVLDFVDFELIRKHPKVFLGYSDTTSALLAIHKMTGMVTFNGPAVITYSKPEVPPFTVSAVEAAVFQRSTAGIPLKLPVSKGFSENEFWLEGDKMTWKPTEKPRALQTVDGKLSVTGLTVAANLDTLMKLAGTKYWPEMDGRILFLEEQDSSGIDLDSKLSHLGMLGVWNQVVGVVFGRFSTKAKVDAMLETLVKTNLKRYGGIAIPVVCGIDWGHTEPCVAIPVGVMCRVTTSPEVSVELLERGVV